MTTLGRSDGSYRRTLSMFGTQDRGPAGGAVGAMRLHTHGVGRGIGQTINTSDIPFRLAGGQKFWIDRIELSYKGPAMTLMGGFGWKPSNTNFDSGRHLLANPYRGWGFITGLQVAESPDFRDYAFTINNAAWYAVAPAANVPNTARDGASFNYGTGRTFDVWVWLMDQSKVDFSNPFPDDKGPAFLTSWVDGGVMQLAG